MKARIIIPSCLVVSFLITGLQLQAERLTLEIWCELEPAVFEGSEYPISAETAAKRLLEEARELFSAMIYGYRFSYTPSDRARGVQDRFELTPLGEVMWGDPRLKILDIEKRESRMFGKISYTLASFQEERRTAWGSNTIPTSTGRGERNVLEGVPAKIGSFEESIKQAIRDYARKRIFNKPREITGEALLWENPRTMINSGAYSTQAKIKLSILDVVPYRFF